TRSPSTATVAPPPRSATPPVYAPNPAPALTPEPARHTPPEEAPADEPPPETVQATPDPPGTLPPAPDHVPFPDPVPVPDPAPHRTARGGRTRAVAVGVAAVVASAAGLGLLGMLAAGAGDDRPDAQARVTTSTEPTTTTAIADLSPQEAFEQAADRLVAGGSFAYAGTTSAIDVSHVRPGLWLAVDLTVEGEVATAAGGAHEIAVDGDGRAAETVSQGPVVWGRLAASRDELPEAAYLPITEESGRQPDGKGVALLPAWLDATVDRRDAGTDARGNRVLRAVLPARVLGEVVDGRSAADADVVLTLDPAGDPVRVEVTSVPSGPPLRLTLDLARIGEPVEIDLPTDAPPRS
ncbi:MAG TPA: hypothetical protein VKD21_10660, partial [Acidimicrobiales bacterium]|nr:hypothetical protein [Acidimicrobiales bacterium]